MVLESLLSILADGEFHSGESLGQQLGVSRAAVWKQLKKLDALGIDCHSVKGRGYRIPGGVNLLQIEQLRQGLAPQTLQGLTQIELALSIPSTNRLAMEQAQLQNCHGRLYLAEQQTAGRGRRGRDWASPFGRNLYFSLSWSFSGGAAALEGLSLVVGLALLQGMQVEGIDGVELKWPNDLLYRGKKLAGVLLEMSGDASGLCQVVVGVGINIAMPQAAAQAIDQPWTDLETVAQRSLDRNRILAGLLNALVPAIQQFEQQGFAPFREQWQQHNAHRDRWVRLATESFAIDGRCLGVNESGALLLQTENGEQAFHGGELSLRSLDDS
ncbi:bifunctional biotin--[acetyl-CoA-carboxylase] ligase/biotin operon repressor BirA [Motiliproteus sp.]|uniref:bifunctional biotin--[acetyl-CoA-carboxylase] ligase/biotin operon repressor BirA n=1 Tax=Motiliproteus sp. TaxID=1898955 RepID=UPI003BAA6E91